MRKNADHSAPIDRVACVSMGAFIGAMYAAGMDADEIDARCSEEWVRQRPLADLHTAQARLDPRRAR